MSIYLQITGFGESIVSSFSCRLLAEPIASYNTTIVMLINY